MAGGQLDPLVEDQLVVALSQVVHEVIDQLLALGRASNRIITQRAAVVEHVHGVAHTHDE